MVDVSLRILAYLQTIPQGKVTTYKHIAEKFAVHPRKVAMIMKYNEDPDLYPCYKVVAYDGKISGYSADGWVSRKIQKLLADGVVIVDGRIDESCIV